MSGTHNFIGEGVELVASWVTKAKRSPSGDHATSVSTIVTEAASVRTGRGLGTTGIVLGASGSSKRTTASDCASTTATHLARTIGLASTRDDVPLCAVGPVCAASPQAPSRAPNAKICVQLPKHRIMSLPRSACARSNAFNARRNASSGPDQLPGTPTTRVRGSRPPHAPHEREFRCRSRGRTRAATGRRRIGLSSLLALVVEPRRDDVLGEDVAAEQELVVASRARRAPRRACPACAGRPSAPRARARRCPCRADRPGRSCSGCRRGRPSSSPLNARYGLQVGSGKRTSMRRAFGDGAA